MQKIKFDELDDLLEYDELREISGGCGSYTVLSNGSAFYNGNSDWKNYVYGTGGTSGGTGNSGFGGTSTFSFSSSQGSCNCGNNNSSSYQVTNFQQDVVKSFYSLNPGTYTNNNSSNNNSTNNSVFNNSFFNSNNNGLTNNNSVFIGGGSGGTGTTKPNNLLFDFSNSVVIKNPNSPLNGSTITLPKKLDFDPNEPVKDGVDFGNKNTKISFDSSLKSTTINEIKDIMKTNTVIKGLLSTFLDGDDNNITFKGSSLALDEAMLTNSIDKTWQNKNIVFTINSPVILTKDGNILFDMKEKDNMNYDRDKVNAGLEEFVVTLTHEVIHAKIRADFANAWSQAKNTSNNDEVKQIMKKNGANDDLLNAIFDAKENTKYNSNIENDIHKYMEKYHTTTIDNALKEYRDDRGIK